MKAISRKIMHCSQAQEGVREKTTASGAFSFCTGHLDLHPFSEIHAGLLSV